LRAANTCCREAHGLQVTEADELLALPPGRSAVGDETSCSATPLADAMQGLLERNRWRAIPVFENYACDDTFARAWFWDRSKSGGHLIEHGVHSSIYCPLARTGKVEAGKFLRPGTGIKISPCTVAFRDASWSISITVSRSGRMDAGVRRVLMGDVRLEE